jgi:hypothetical protein
MVKAKIWAVGGALVLLSGIGAVGAATTAPTQASAATQARTVPLDCSQDFGDSRTAADASVQPGVIVADTIGWPYLPVTYTAYSIDDTGHLQVIGAFSTIETTDHLVAAWQNSTNCFGSSISRNAWVADSSGAVFGQSDFSGPPTGNFGSMAGQHLNQPMVGMSPTSDANGYWLVASDGGIFAFGDAQFHGSTGNIRLNQPVTGMAVTPDGSGYWLVASDGGIFAFNAPFYGSTGNLRLNKPIEAMIPTPDGGGYWMVASDGGIFAFGDAGFHGSLGGQTLSAPIAGMIPNGSGYTLIGQDGQLYPFS